MGAYTDTYIKISKVERNTINRLIDGAIKGMLQTSYGKAIREGWENGLESWLKLHKENYDYFVKECDVDPSHMTEEYLTQEYHKRVNILKGKINDLILVKEGKMDFLECLKKHKMIKDYSDFWIREYKNDYYINTKYEIFRNCEYDQLRINLHTVEDLINHLKQPHLSSIKDLTAQDAEYGPLTVELEQKIRDYYSAIGDNNFLVNFG